jgi:hypothetical protein
MKYILILLFLSIPLYGSIGLTKELCNKKYGKPTKVVQKGSRLYHEELQYQYYGLIINGHLRGW